MTDNLYKFAYDLILSKIDPVAEQAPHASKEVLTNGIFQAKQQGRVQILPNVRRRTIHILVHKNGYVADVHIFSDTNSPWDIVISHKQFLDWVRDKTSYEKLEAGTVHSALCKVMERTGWQYEGTRSQSHISRNGQLDLHLYGYKVRR